MKNTGIVELNSVTLFWRKKTILKKNQDFSWKKVERNFLPYAPDALIAQC